MKIKINVIITFLLVFVMPFLFAQEKTITGNVVFESAPLTGVSIIIDSTTIGTLTDFNGHYTIDVKIGDILHFSYVGMTTISMTVGTDDLINVTMVYADNELDEIVLAGVAGATSKKKLSISVASIGSDELDKVPASSVESALQGKVAGVAVLRASWRQRQPA